MKTFRKMLKIEGILSIRDMNMVCFAIIMPIIVLIVLGFIYGNKPAFEGANYTFIEQSFGALCTIAISAGGLMGLPILVSDYREKKILKKLMATPISPAMILFVHLVIYSLYALISMLSLWIICEIFFEFKIHGSILTFIGGWFLVLISTLSIGMLVGAVAKNTKRASVIASALYFPMLIFSGATIPYEVMPDMMQKIANIMPVTLGIKILKAGAIGESIGNVVIPIIILAILTIICIIIAIKNFKWN